MSTQLRDSATRLPAERAGATGIGLYVHWPFCASKCPYCDFNSHVAGAIDHHRWRAAFRRALAHAAGETGPARLASIFFGGGTPSLMAPRTVAAVIDEATRLWRLDADAEITLEANPGSVEAGRFRGYRLAGVNRISIGIQSLDDEALRRLGRLHSAAEARMALGIAHSLFDRLSFDLIYARQDQSLAGWRAELAGALDLAGEHLSLYQLTIEPGTRFGDLARVGRLRGLPPPDLAADMFALTQEMCEAAGLPAYEISSHARPGGESRHNLIYWRGGAYIGVGPGAHGRLMRDGVWIATSDRRDPAAWLAAVERNGHGRAEETVVSGSERAEELLMMGLRLREGFDTARHDALAEAPLDPVRLDELVAAGFLWREGSRIGTTAAGRPVLDALIARLLG
ncbi:MAG: coproporphyrinogen III oxidase [Alphaproteobacteria bacterium]|nr:MAG: coproporphyrinogen III oxidase [Alphaproteobacteria bacterium]